MKLLTYNIQAGIGTNKASDYGTRLHRQVVHTKPKRRILNSIAKMIADYDCVCLQEVDLGGLRAGFNDQGHFLQSESGLPHYISQENRRVPIVSRHGNAIISRFEIDDIKDLKLPGSVRGRGALIATIESKPKTTVVCTHLSLGPSDQQEQLEFIGENLPKSGRVIVCGDLNCAANSPILRSFCERFDLKQLTTAHHESYPSWAPKMAIDHILSNIPPVSKVEVVPLNRPLSDHCPIKVTF